MIDKLIQLFRNPRFGREATALRISECSLNKRER